MFTPAWENKQDETKQIWQFSWATKLSPALQQPFRCAMSGFTNGPHVVSRLHFFSCSTLPLPLFPNMPPHHPCPQLLKWQGMPQGSWCPTWERWSLRWHDYHSQLLIPLVSRSRAGFPLPDSRSTFATTSTYEALFAPPNPSLFTISICLMETVWKTASSASAYCDFFLKVQKNRADNHHSGRGVWNVLSELISWLWHSVLCDLS